MFGKLKDKLKGWFVSSKEKIEEDAEVVETGEVETEEVETEGVERDTDNLKQDKKSESQEESELKESVEDTKKEIREKEAELEKVDEMIRKARDEPSEHVPKRFDTAKRGYEPDLEKIQEEAEGIKKEVEEARKKEKDIKEFEKEIEKVKGEDIPEVPVKFEVGKQKFDPDLEEIKSKTGLFSKVRARFAYKISEEEFNEIFEDLEMLLLENNVALEAVEEIRKILEKRLVGKEIKRDKLEEEIKNELKNTLNEILIEPDNPLDIIKISEKPFKILFFGINGTGKTTSIAKVASFLKKAGFSVVLAAGDTFRAASIEQISEHADMLGVKLIKQDYGTDPAAVGFDAVKYAEKHKIDVVLIDTAGRMHTKANLMSEMDKIVRVVKPNLKIFVAESIAGNDAVEQAKTFHEEIGMDGMILTKADIDDKGGTVISVSHATRKPIFYLGVGQKYDDLELFNKQKFIDGLLG